MKEILSKFKNGEELYRENALFNVCVYQLLNGADIYHLLEKVILMNSAQQNKIQKILENQPQKILIQYEHKTN